MAYLDFTTSGVMRITLSGARFGKIVRDPGEGHNVKMFKYDADSIEIAVHNMNAFSGWGRVAILDEGGPGAVMTVDIDSNAVGWYGTAQFVLHGTNGQHIVSDNFQSLVGGIPGSARQKKYNIRSL